MKKLLLLFLVSTNCYSSTENDEFFRLRLKNDFRNASRPSAGDGKDIYAWVQGIMLDYRTPQYSGWLSAEGGGYYIKRLDTKSNYVTRGYLKGNESFGIYYGAVNFSLKDNAHIKAGRFGTDTGYGSLPYDIPLISGGSTRTTPTLSEGVLGKYRVNDQVELWGMWRYRVFNWSDVNTGVRHEGVYDYITGTYDRHEPRVFFAGIYDNNHTRFSLGASYQKDVSFQTKLNSRFTYVIDGNRRLKYEFLYFGADLVGDSKHVSNHDSTNVFSSKVTYSLDKHSIYAAGGYVSHIIDNVGGNVDTDVGYVGALSIDRNKENMLSAQIGYSYSLNENLNMSIAPLYTKGYEDSSRNIPIEGRGVLLGMNYNINSGFAKGLQMFLYSDYARENRKNSSVGDNLEYWDVKAGFKYDFNF